MRTAPHLVLVEPDPEPPLSDQALVAACARGDRQALGSLFDRHSRSLANFLGRAFGRSADIDDLVQQTFLTVWDVADRFNDKSAVRTWILGIGANHARNHSRSKTRRSLALATYQRHLKDASPPRPDRIAEQREKLRRLEDALEGLSADLRITFVMCEIEHVPGAEAAKVLGVRAGTIWRRLHQARRLLSSAIEEE